MVELEKIIEGLEMVDDNIKDTLNRLIQGKGAFRRFKDYCIDVNIIQNWYGYREQRYKDIAINWCRENNLKYETK